MTGISEDFSGIIREYFDDAPSLVKKETPYKNGIINGTQKEYTRDFYSDSITLMRETPYVDGLKHGIEKFYDPYHPDETTETPYELGKREGIEIQEDPSGITLTEFHNDKENGISIIYYHGDISTVTFCDGKRQGAKVESFGTDLLGLTYYLDDKKHGPEIHWGFDGFETWLHSIEQYSQGYKHGKEYLFNDDGEVIQVNDYLNGELVSSKTDNNTLRIAKLIEIPKILEKSQVSQHKENVLNQYNEFYKLMHSSDDVLHDEIDKTGAKYKQTPSNDRFLTAALIACKKQNA